MKWVRFLHARPFLLGGQFSHPYTRARGHVKRSLSTPLSRSDVVKPFLPPRLSRPELDFQLTLLPHLRTFSAPSTTLIDPSRPSLFYHLLPPPNSVSKDLPAYAVSLLERPPKDAQSAVIMGWLPAAVSNEAGDEAGLGDFKENSEFLDVVHQVIRKAVEDGNDERLTAEAIQLGDGWMHINDDRHLPEMGRISTPDDIIASVRVEGGELLPETYSPMPTYRICTTDGLTTLSKGLEQRLLEELRRIEIH